jgi:UPF0755 protein
MAEQHARRSGAWKLLLLATIAGAVAVAVVSRRSAGGTARIALLPGATLGTASDALQRAGVIRSAALFRLVAMVRGRSDDTMKPGRYVVMRSASYSELLDQLVSGANRYRKLTIPEGWSIQQIARLMQDSLAIPVDSLIAATRDSVRRTRMQTTAADLEGYLFPATYEFTDAITAGQIIDSMTATFDNRWKTSWDATLKQSGRTRHAAVTLASIVEKEARKDAERPLIAAVYLNRLRDGMRLQADPTVLYALGVVAKRVLYADLNVQSPYNTYRVAGLPPGPIASPGTASLAAAVNPATSDAKFFVAFPDGHHEFRKTFKEHEVAVAAARVARDSAAPTRQ